MHCLNYLHRYSNCWELPSWTKEKEGLCWRSMKYRTRETLLFVTSWDSRTVYCGTPLVITGRIRNTLPNSSVSCSHRSDMTCLQKRPSRIWFITTGSCWRNTSRWRRLRRSSRSSEREETAGKGWYLAIFSLICWFSPNYFQFSLLFFTLDVILFALYLVLMSLCVTSTMQNFPFW